jgi:hypothetical protein
MTFKDETLRDGRWRAEGIRSDVRATAARTVKRTVEAKELPACSAGWWAP